MTTTHHPVSDELKAAVDEFFGGQNTVFAIPNTTNHSANFYGDTEVCEMDRQDVSNLIQIAHSDWTTIDDDGETIRSMTESEAIRAVLDDLQHDKPE